MSAERRFVLVTGGSFGDMLPFFGLARHLRDSGEDVLLVAGRDGEILARAERLAYHAFAGATGDLELDAGRPFRTFLRLTEARVVRPLARQVDELAGLVRDGDVIVGHPIALAAPIVARSRALPWITVSPATWLFRSAERMPLYLPRRTMGRPLNRLGWSVFERALDRRFLPHVAGVARSAGWASPPVSFLALCRSPERTLLLTSPVMLDGRRLDPEVTVTGLGQWDRIRLWRGAGALRRFIEAGEPPVVFRAPPNLPTAPLRAAAAEACRRLGVRGLFIDYDAEPGEAPDGMHVERYVPLSVLAPQVQAAVHYGGIGTAAAFASAGVPAVITPSIVDQFESAEVISAHGAAVRLDWARLTPERLIRALERALERRAAAEVLGRRLRAERGFEVAVQTLTSKTPETSARRSSPASS
jgi:UDP:flavonoid glycosyltransferase YjiC (YdhE family)